MDPSAMFGVIRWSHNEGVAVHGNKPLSGIRVIEVGQLLAGPFAGTLLAYFGAEVIKVEPPGDGDPIRGWRLLDKDGTSFGGAVWAATRNH